MVTIRRARPGDADAMARVHLAAWRSTYAGVLPEAYLAQLNETQESLGYERAILERRGGHAGFVAVADKQEAPGGGVIGFITGGMSRRPTSPRARSRHSIWSMISMTAGSAGG